MLEKRRAQKKAASEKKTFLMVDKFTRGAVEKTVFDFDEEKKKAGERKAKKKQGKYSRIPVQAWLYLTHTNHKAT